MSIKEFEGVPMSPDMFDHLIGANNGYRQMEYTWRDVSLYGVGVGAQLKDRPYYYERYKGGFKALPTFVLLPYINNITMHPLTEIPGGTNEIVRDFMEEKLGYMPSGLHMAMEMTVEQPIDPYKGTFVVKDRLNNVLDRGEGKGTVTDCKMDVYDIAGNHVSELHSYHYNKAFGGFGGDKFTTPHVAYPDREPDYETTEFMVENLAAIYRLTGDTYNVHVDEDVAAAYGYPKPFMMGLCTYGFAVRMVIQQLFPYEPERVNYIYGQIRNVCYPGGDVTVKTWKADDEENTVYFKMFDKDDRLLLGNCILKYK